VNAASASKRIEDPCAPTEALRVLVHEFTLERTQQGDDLLAELRRVRGLTHQIVSPHRMPLANASQFSDQGEEPEWASRVPA
jgi:hypothetical protein